MIRVVSSDRVKMTRAKNVPSTADAKIIDAAEVLMFRENPLGKWVGPYVVR